MITSNKKEIGYIGLGKMGKNMIIRLRKNGWRVVGYDRAPENTAGIAGEGAIPAASVAELVSKLSTPRLVWLMVPHQVVDEVIKELTPMLTRGDLIVDGGNSPYQESIRRAQALEAQGIDFLDIGVSGGPGGALSGACMMVGGKQEVYQKIEDVGFFKDTCLEGGCGHMGPHGAGHFVKMVHNGIEYGMIQAIAEGFDLMRHSKEFKLDLEKISEVYSHGSVITSSLVSWMHDAYKKYGPDLVEISGRASSTGEGVWTVEAGKREVISMPVIQSALEVREASQTQPSYQGKIVSAMRGEFGQHPVRRKEDEPEVL